MRVARTTSRVLTALSLAAVLLGTAGPACAQGFGKNKVQYAALDWTVF
jgi:hypothetical protein